MTHDLRILVGSHMFSRHAQDVSHVRCAGIGIAPQSMPNCRILRLRCLLDDLQGSLYKAIALSVLTVSFIPLPTKVGLPHATAAVLRSSLALPHKSSATHSGVSEASYCSRPGVGMLVLARMQPPSATHVACMNRIWVETSVCTLLTYNLAFSPNAAPSVGNLSRIW